MANSGMRRKSSLERQPLSPLSKLVKRLYSRSIWLGKTAKYKILSENNNNKRITLTVNKEIKCTVQCITLKLIIKCEAKIIINKSSSVILIYIMVHKTAKALQHSDL